MEIEIANLDHITGVRNSQCFGIVQTIDQAAKKAKSFHVDKVIYVYFHMPAGSTEEDRQRTLGTLRQRFGPLGSDVVMVEHVEDVLDGAPFIIGTRGAPPAVREQIQRRGMNVIMDTTCPYVKAQEAAARELLEDGYQLVFSGLSAYHGLPRLRGIAQQFNKELFVLKQAEDVDQLRLKRSTRIGVILQTTWHMDLAQNIVVQLAKRFREIKIIDTSCIDSLGRVPAARKLAERNDVIVVLDIGSVAKYLADEIQELADESARSVPVRVFRVQNKRELRPEWLEGIERVGVIGGVNVHMRQLEELAGHIRELATARVNI